MRGKFARFSGAILRMVGNGVRSAKGISFLQFERTVNGTVKLFAGQDNRYKDIDCFQKENSPVCYRQASTVGFFKPKTKYYKCNLNMKELNNV
jgi:hypothetical protein